jgi:hypothetical protein
MRMRELLTEWTETDFNSAVDWRLDWIAGNEPATKRHLEHAIQVKAINQTGADELDGFMHETLGPYVDLPSIQDLDVRERIELMKDISENS